MTKLRTTLLVGLFAIAFALLCAPSVARAGQSITFIHEGTTTSGFVLNGQGFPGTYDFVVTAFGDVGDREELPSGRGWYIDHTGATIEIVGFGTFGIVTPTRTWVGNSAQLVGFGRAGARGANLFDGPTNAAFFDWEMTTSIGPISGNDGELLQWHLDPQIETTGGILQFPSQEDIPVTFTAEVVIASPAPIALLPIAAVLCPRRRRRE